MNIRIKNQQSAISNQQFVKGFSLTEVLLAVGTLAVGMLFIAGVFPVSIHLITISSERTIAATVADEAFAKIKLYGVNIADPNWNIAGQTPFEFLAPFAPIAEYGYPSTPTADPVSKRYWWSAICRRVGPSDVQVTVFVSRKTGAAKFNALNPLPPPTFITNVDRPVAVPVEVSGTTGSYELTITGKLGNKTWINDGYRIVDDVSGQIYRVLERYPNYDTVIKLDQPWQGGAISSVWVVPPPSSPGGGRYPCIAVYQKVMRF